jgi:hypothetical protein
VRPAFRRTGTRAAMVGAPRGGYVFPHTPSAVAALLSRAVRVRFLTSHRFPTDEPFKMRREGSGRPIRTNRSRGHVRKGRPDLLCSLLGTDGSNLHPGSE